jgi:DNA mismatch repair protein MutH
MSNAKCQNCTMPIRLDRDRGWVHQTTGMKLCASGGGSVRPPK